MTYYVNPPHDIPSFTPHITGQKIGKCSVCGGDVVLPDTWMGTPRGRCSKCGRREKSNLPIIQME